MAFLDKITDIAKNIGDKAVDVAKDLGDRTSDAIETQKIKNKIASDRREFENQMKLIGQYYYEAYLRDATCDENIKNFIVKAQEHAAAIEAGKAAIEALKEDLPSQ
jgi:dolichyl-phosphate-mannose-protein mannosyltransferase